MRASYRCFEDTAIRYRRPGSRAPTEGLAAVTQEQGYYKNFLFVTNATHIYSNIETNVGTTSMTCSPGGGESFLILASSRPRISRLVLALARLSSLG